jgi:polysaccharide export outer membrane protein
MRHAAFLVLICIFLAESGCSYNPKFTADVTGLGGLPQERPPLPTLDDASTLPALSPGAERPTYRIGPLDEISVIVWGRPDLGSQVPSERESQRKLSTVGAEGGVTLPFLDRLDIAGLTATEAAQLIQDSYALSVTTPQVELEIDKFRSKAVDIAGEVTRPGIVYLSDNIMTLAEALVAAGGPTDGADTRHALLVRDGTSYHLDYWAGQRGQSAVLDVLLRDGDRVFFPSVIERVYYVLGDVENQGAYPIQDKGTTLLEGLAAAGGPDLNSAKLRPITFIRLRGEEATVYEFKLSELMEAGDIPLFPGDRIYISRTGVWYWGFVWRQMVPVISLISAAWFLDRLITE